MRKLTNKPLLTLLMSIFLSSQIFAQNGLNKTQKQIFANAKEIFTKDNNTITSIIMIVVVLAIVGIALYLSFKDDRLKPTL